MDHISYITNNLHHFITEDTAIMSNLWIAIILIVFFKIISGPLTCIIVKVLNFKIKSVKKLKQHSFYKPLRFFFVLLGLYLGLLVLEFPHHIVDTITRIFKICTILLAARGLANLFNTSSDTYVCMLEKIGIKGCSTTLVFIGKIVKFLIYIIAGFMILTDLGYELGGLATGLGISTVIIALATQDIARSFLGGLSILTDRSFEIGDVIETNTFSGTVEDITLRTTRLRDIHNQVIIIPNSRMMDSFIINTSKQEKRRFNLPLTISVTTPLDKIKAVENKLKESLECRTDIIQDGINITLNNIAANKIEILINFYTDITDPLEYAKFKEELNFIILDIMHKEEITLM